MTEYDYSPEAYERYMDNQNRVNNWVFSQTHHAPGYSNPFVPRSTSTPPSQPHHPSHHQDRNREPSSRFANPTPASYRPDPKRSQTTPAPLPASAYKQHSRSPSSSRHHTPQYSYGQPGYYQTSPVSYVPPAPRGSKDVVTTYTFDPRTTREIVLPPPRRGETYVVIPSKGQKIEVIHESSHSSRTSRSSTRSPTKKGQPLLKRIFTNFGHGSSAQSGRTAAGSGRRERTRSY